KRALKPDTVVSLAAFRESEATDTKEGPAKQRQLRDEARQSYQEALRLDPNCLAAYQGLGRVYTELNDWQRAMEAYRTGLEKHPRDPALWFGQGVCLCRQKNFAQAAESLRKALQLNPENRQILKELGLCLARAGRMDEALPYLVQAVGAPTAHWYLARMTLHLAEQGAMAAAPAQAECRRHLQIALQADAGFAPAQQMLASLDVGSQPRVNIEFMP